MQSLVLIAGALLILDKYTHLRREQMALSLRAETQVAQWDPAERFEANNQVRRIVTMKSTFAPP